jgi:uncharacterized protein with ACT and thioredoxin-like domain
MIGKLERHMQLADIQRAATGAILEALRRHMLLGESIAVVGEHDTVKVLEPEDIRQVLKAA